MKWRLLLYLHVCDAFLTTYVGYRLALLAADGQRNIVLAGNQQNMHALEI